TQRRDLTRPRRRRRVRTRGVPRRPRRASDPLPHPTEGRPSTRRLPSPRRPPRHIGGGGGTDGGDAVRTLLDAARSAPIDGVLAECRELVEDPDFPTVARWREGGGRVIGHFQVYFPEELAHAAGALPVKVR